MSKCAFLTQCWPIISEQREAERTITFPSHLLLAAAEFTDIMCVYLCEYEQVSSVPKSTFFDLIDFLTNLLVETTVFQRSSSY